MMDFSDIRSIIQAKQIPDDLVNLEVKLKQYRGRPDVILRYIIESWGWCPSQRWEGGGVRMGKTHDLYALRAVDLYCSQPLSATVNIGGKIITLMRWEQPLQAVWEAVYSIVHETYQTLFVKELEDRAAQEADPMTPKFSLMMELNSAIFFVFKEMLSWIEDGCPVERDEDHEEITPTWRFNADQFHDHWFARDDMPYRHDMMVRMMGAHSPDIMIDRAAFMMEVYNDCRPPKDCKTRQWSSILELELQMKINIFMMKRAFERGCFNLDDLERSLMT